MKLSTDLDQIKALAKNSDSLASISSPFHKLKCVKLPKEYAESSIPSAFRSYLLSCSPGATIVTSLRRRSKLLDLQALRMVKLMTEIQNAFGTNLAAGFIGDDLLSGP
ncbi:hypothetical protein POM88_024058 [Heracleum sosnowskyi]|uniref:Uncharacterized protein n=1 Tax=Heracleum sosnowskyi TaxID=360622 RepID=A0AAD8IKJ7_9APIA|nr:hypothetical protein POM88_024058 [Heracleum sosnowskyi]